MTYDLTGWLFLFETQRRRGAEEQRASILTGSLCSSLSLRFKLEPANHLASERREGTQYACLD